MEYCLFLVRQNLKVFLVQVHLVIILAFSPQSGITDMLVSVRSMAVTFRSEDPELRLEFLSFHGSSALSLSHS